MKTHILMPIMIFMTKFYHSSTLSSIISAVSTNIYTAFLIITVIAIAATITSCEEDPTNIGEGMFPGSDFVTIKSTDTLSVFGYTAYDNKVRPGNLSNLYLGKLSDPFFGETTSDFVAQLRLIDPWPGGGAFTVDAVEFFMYIAAAEGSLTSQHYISLSESMDYLSSDSIYYSNRKVHAGPAFGGRDFGTYPLPEIKADTTIVIPLPVSVGEYLMRDTAMLFYSSKETEPEPEPDFSSFFKGLYVSLADSPEPLFLTTSLSSGTGIFVYYHYNSDTTRFIYPFYIKATSIAFNRYSHSFNTALPDKKILYINERIKDSVTYIQNYGGVYTRIEIPGLKELKNMMPFSVNKARLNLPVYFDSDSTLYKLSTLPTRILARYKTEAGVMDTIPDYYLSPFYMGGTFNKKTNEYTFNIAAFTQLYLEGKIPDPVLELFLPVSISKNMIFKMNENDNPAKLEFTYTKF
jgi:hypothetical protein